MAMAMARTYFLQCPNLMTPFTSTSPTKYHCFFHPSSVSFSYNHKKDKRHLPFLALASSSIPEVINVDYLEKEFNNNGFSYTSIGDSCAVKIGLENGSIATLLLPSGLITSYKPHMWHGSTMEILHTTVTEEEDGSPLIQGGVYVDLKCGSEDGFSWSPKNWVLFDVRGSPEEIIQVELISRDSDSMVEAKYIVTLHPDLLTSELVITSSKDSSLELFGSIMSHLTVSSPDATYAIGLEGSTYCNKPPFISSYSIIPPDFSQGKPTGSGQSWGQNVLQGLSSFSDSWGGTDTNNNNADIKSRIVQMEEEEMEEEEDDNDAQLTEKMSRIYTYAPRRFTIIDRGRRNSVVVGRSGFDEQYIFSPGSRHDFYGKYAYICTGPSAMRKPIVLGPKSVWRGEQSLYNPNL